MIYTTHTSESLNSTVSQAVRSRGHFPNDRAAAKLIYLALRRVQRSWRAEFAIHFGERFPGLPMNRPSQAPACRAPDWTHWMLIPIWIQSTLCRAVPRYQPHACLAPPASLPSNGTLLSPHNLPDSL